ncbi:hypothetical protein CONCODRAFT_70296 [Conidiobolus coronatus NRRL 28638]|uniref:C2 domain-containing protein n=1 Tax=Conidiobolus coronatus (strain ATCC 28846 / CBS 209.66 / NRRL 28638) TaxID=796925 RepID=A0A137P7A4_CONC2|nr:hypothetical protein CONCODRAFT_70296 [Conidiobolus coronatus NRRL 28638]|eukprot:KXN70893.1 hypothetical protein CONCODRAFT_70296 [Conidiobolus coronatus NRRL 28638]
MTKILVDVIAARNLKGEDGLLGKNDPYLQLKVGNMLTGQKHKTKTHKNVGSQVDFGESFEFDVHENDDLKVRLYDDDTIMDDKIGEAKIPLRGLFEHGQLQSWFPLGEGSKCNGEVLLNIHT